ncbi:MAG: NAD-dependent epimerase/dehydratase family protein [Coriobacteriaceae bacterium]|nr:NAD-dependent epimerase/dehydratase family protein [Coriobacteriaceae bacterium]
MPDNIQEPTLLAQGDAIDWEVCAHKAFFVSGATGLIGSTCIRTLLERNRLFDAGITVYALVRSEERAKSFFGEAAFDEGLELVVSDLDGFDCFDIDVDFIIHAACPTVSNFFVDSPVETARTIVDGTCKMLELARHNEGCSFLFLSSMEVYGDGNVERGLEHKLGEADVGYVDPLSLRSCYPEGKRMAEHLVCAYASEYGVDAKVIRLAQTFGPGIPKDDKRVFSYFAHCAIDGDDIVLRTTGESTRMYLFIADAVTAIFTVLLCGQAGCAYNAANEDTYSSVKEMAELVAEHCANGRIAVRVEVDPEAPYPPEHHLPLDTSALRALGWQAETDLSGMFEALIGYLRD